MEITYKIILILTFAFLVSCQDKSDQDKGDQVKSVQVNNDPIVVINLTERRNGFRLETTIDQSGKVFRGYYHESNMYYANETRFTLQNETNIKLWKLINQGSIERKRWSIEPANNFKSIGVGWQGKDSTYGTSYSYKELEQDSTLDKVLKVIKEENLDNWTTLN